MFIQRPPAPSPSFPVLSLSLCGQLEYAQDILPLLSLAAPSPPPCPLLPSSPSFTPSTSSVPFCEASSDNFLPLSLLPPSDPPSSSPSPCLPAALPGLSNVPRVANCMKQALQNMRPTSSVQSRFPARVCAVTSFHPCSPSPLPLWLGVAQSSYEHRMLLALCPPLLESITPLPH
eukprot:290335-Hanusia_phi.AAC.1